jgi:glutathione S-transferase
MGVVLHGYEYSVYTRVARLVLAEKAVDHDYVEVNPFACDVPAEYLAMHPFRRVPTLVHDDFVIYETAAITRYVDETFGGVALQPTGSRPRARVVQII